MHQYASTESKQSEQTGLRHDNLSRRRFLYMATAALDSASLTARALRASKRKRRPKVAAVFTIFTHRSHAHGHRAPGYEQACKLLGVG